MRTLKEYFDNSQYNDIIFIKEFCQNGGTFFSNQCNGINFAIWKFNNSSNYSICYFKM